MKTGIYFMIRQNVVVYVGKTVKWPKRIGFHSSQLMDFDQVKFLEYPEEELLKYEKAYIEKYHPEYNISHNQPVKRGRKKLYSFKVGSPEWKKQVHKMRFRKLTLKSTIDFGRHATETVQRMFDLGYEYELIHIYYCSSHITFFDDILEKLKIIPNWAIQKPGTNKEMFHTFCEVMHPDLVEQRKRSYAIRSRKKAKNFLKGVAQATRSKLHNRNINQSGGY